MAGCGIFSKNILCSYYRKGKPIHVQIHTPLNVRLQSTGLKLDGDRIHADDYMSRQSNRDAHGGLGCLETAINPSKEQVLHTKTTFTTSACVHY